VCDHSGGDDHHDHLGEVTTPPSGGALVLDIGGDVGALTVLLDSDWLRYEVHARKVGDGVAAQTIHTGVWERTIGGELVVAGLFCELTHGIYELLDRDGSTMSRVAIEGGVVGHIDLRSIDRDLVGSSADS
jgi:hypothetical protein